MTVKALEIIEDAYNEIGVKPAEVELTDNEKKTAVRYLNRIMAQLAAATVYINYTILETADDDITTPDYTHDYMVCFLAIRLSGSYGVQVSQSLAAAAQLAEQIVKRNTVKIPEVAYPNTLPVGEGNKSFDNNNYFHDELDNLQTSEGSDYQDGTGDDIDVD